MREEICSECQGNGYVEYTGSPGYYSLSLGYYLPREEVVRCRFCGGTGVVEVEDAYPGGTQEDWAA